MNYSFRRLDMRKLTVAILVGMSPWAIAQELPREFTMLSGRDLILACTVHTTFLATTASQSADPQARKNVPELVKHALVWKRESAREQTIQAETQSWRARVEVLGPTQVREQAGFCIRQANRMFEAMPSAMQSDLKTDAGQQATRLLAAGDK